MKNENMSKFTFIDLFSGIGGFHQAMKNLGGECTYRINYGMDSGYDINDIKDEMIPNHDVLCAGFPCQTFSKAGKQMGFKDPTKGTLFLLKYRPVLQGNSNQER